LKPVHNYFDYANKMNQYQFDAYNFKPILENVEEVKEVDAGQQIEVDPELEARLEPILTSILLPQIKALVPVTSSD
jgi:hypothetical protein